MPARLPALAPLLGALALSFAAGAHAQGREVYRYVDPDGRVVYSDRAPGSEARDVQTKRIQSNTIQTSEAPIAVQVASQRYPVTLYTFPCGDACDSATALLNRRGVPFETVNVEEAKNAERLQQLTGETLAPVLQVGDRLLAKGFNEARWNALLDEAGYPKTPPRRSGPPARTAGEATADARRAQP
jgi:glutaredoxin